MKNQFKTDFSVEFIRYLAFFCEKFAICAFGALLSFEKSAAEIKSSGCGVEK